MQRRGWSVEGVEVSSSSLRISDFPVRRVDFSVRQVLQPQFDAVTAFAVLEHAHDPMTFFRNVAAALCPGGTFIFLVTNFDSISSRELYREDVPRHLYFFSERTIADYLQRNGFDLIEARFDDSIYEMRPVNWLRYYWSRVVRRRRLQRQDLPLGRSAFFASRGLRGGFLPNLRYAARHPLAAIDLALLPLFEQYQKLTRSYGIVTCVAVKRT
jgi:SAM-dependent methyltransferase